MLVESSSGESLYYCSCSEWKAVPNIVLHVGAERTQGPVIAGAEFRKGTSLFMVLGEGAESKENYGRGVDQEDGGEGGAGGGAMVEMKLVTKWKQGKYSLAVPKSGAGGEGVVDGVDGKERVIEWNRTRKREHGCERIARWSQNNFAISDVEIGQLLGVTVRDPKFSMRHKGKLVVRSDVPEDVKLYLLLGAVGMTEKARRWDARWQSGE